MLHGRQAIAKTIIGHLGNRWPKTTADLAFRVFTRTAPRKDSSVADDMAEAGTPIMLQIPGGLVATWSLPAPSQVGRKALLVHGWNSRAKHMLALAKSLNDAGVETVLLDLPGHGASTGKHLHLGKGIDAIDATWRHHGPFDAIIGHSFGGSVALNAALGSAMCVPARRPSRLVMIASPNSMPAIFRWFGRRVGLPEKAQDALERRVLTLLGQSLDLLVASDQLVDTDLPVLVVHDMDDKDVPYADALRMARAGPHVRLHTTNGLGHRRVLKDSGVHSAVVGFLTKERQDQPARVSLPVRECA